MNIHLIALGCPKNLVDSEFILGRLQGRSAKIVDDPRKADVIIVNTCGFIEDAKKESIETIFSALKLKKQGFCHSVFVTGCLSERYKSQLRNEIPEIDRIWGARNIPKISMEIAQSLGMKDVEADNNRRFLTTRPSYAYLKIAEGCDSLCTFCAIPAIRGPHLSRPEKEILQEANDLAKQGVKELILISQDTTYYGTDLKTKTNLATLLRKIEPIPGLQWIRILYTYPERISDELIETVAKSEKVCHYFDIPIQHVSDRILLRMKRGSRKKKIENLIIKIRNKIPDVAIRTSLIVGFPGETEQEFEELLEFVEEQKFERLGVFKYSPEKGTEAADFPDQIPEAIKQDRYDLLMATQRDISISHNEKLIGRKLEIHVDHDLNGNGTVVGRTRWDAPDIDQTVLITEKIDPGSFIFATISQVREYDLIGNILKNSN